MPQSTTNVLMDVFRLMSNVDKSIDFSGHLRQFDQIRSAGTMDRVGVKSILRIGSHRIACNSGIMNYSMALIAIASHICYKLMQYRFASHRMC